MNIREIVNRLITCLAAAYFVNYLIGDMPFSALAAFYLALWFTFNWGDGQLERILDAIRSTKTIQTEEPSQETQL